MSGAAFSYEFFPYHYGPYSRDLAEDLSQLNEFGLVEETPHIGVGDVIRYDYSLTEEGEELAIQVEKRLGREELQALQKAYSEWKDRQTLELITLAKFYMANEQFVESESME